MSRYGVLLALLTALTRSLKVEGDMNEVLFMSMKKLKNNVKYPDIVRAAAKHNLREIVAELGAAPDGRINPSRVKLNVVLRGADTSAGIADTAKTLLKSAGITRLRKDAVRALEFIFSLPPNTTIDNQTYFADATAWVASYFGVPLISSIVHLDEAAPHCHVLALPLVGGRMNGSELMGGPSRLQTIQSDFYAQVAQQYGLQRQAPSKHRSKVSKREATATVLGAIMKDPCLLNDPKVRQALGAAIAKDPAPLIRALGFDMPESKSRRKKTFVEIMTKPVKPEKAIGFERQKPIGLVDNRQARQHQTLSSVGFANGAQPDPLTIEPQIDATQYGRAGNTVTTPISPLSARQSHWPKHQMSLTPLVLCQWPVLPSKSINALIGQKKS
jgi:hypothetical protein